MENAVLKGPRFAAEDSPLQCTFSFLVLEFEYWLFLSQQLIPIPTHIRRLRVDTTPHILELVGVLKRHILICFHASSTFQPRIHRLHLKHISVCFILKWRSWRFSRLCTIAATQPAPGSESWSRTLAEKALDSSANIEINVQEPKQAGGLYPILPSNLIDRITTEAATDAVNFFIKTLASNPSVARQVVASQVSPFCAILGKEYYYDSKKRRCRTLSLFRRGKPVEYYMSHPEQIRK